MTLSIVLLIILPLFLIPSILLSLNRLRSLLFSLLPGTALLFLIILFDAMIPSLMLNERIGGFFSNVFLFIFKGYNELDSKEIIHLSATFGYFLIYLICFAICVIPVKIFYVGINPSIHKRIRLVQRLFDIILFLATTYGVLAIFLIEIREIIPLQDGFLSFLFNAIYRLEI